MPLRQNMFVEGEKTPGAWEGESPHRASVFTDDYGKALDGEILVAFQAGLPAKRLQTPTMK
jgi:hypothetical protein